MAIIPNPITAIVAFLKADTDVATEVGTRVFGAELPEDETVLMPRKCLVIAGSGGPATGLSRLSINTIRIDIKGYGPTPELAWGPYLAAHNALKQLVPTKQDTALLYDAHVAGGPSQLRDSDLEWPLVFGSFEVRHSELAI